MRLIRLTVENFRCYDEPVSVSFDNLTAIIGKNDVGKSSLLEALDIFFENGKPDKDDASKSGDPKAMRITCEFDRLPSSLIVDSDFRTTLADEYLLSQSGTLVIQKTFNGTLATPKATSVVAIANHPTAPGYEDLLKLKKSELSKRATELGADLEEVDKRINAQLRSAIWSSCADLRAMETEVDLDTEGGKQVWASLQAFLPTFALFKSDRARRCHQLSHMTEAAR